MPRFGLAAAIAALVLCAGGNTTVTMTPGPAPSSPTPATAPRAGG